MEHQDIAIGTRVGSSNVACAVLPQFSLARVAPSMSNERSMFFVGGSVDLVTVAWGLLLIGGTWAWKNRRIKEFFVIAFLFSVAVSQIKKNEKDAWLEEPAMDYFERIYGGQEGGEDQLNQLREQLPGIENMNMGHVMETLMGDGIAKVDMAVVNKKTDHLILEGVMFGPVSAQTLARAIEDDITWKRVSFVGCTLDPTAAETIARAFWSNSRIAHVDFDKVGMEQDTLQVLVLKLISQIPTIQIVSFDKCGIDDDGAANISRALEGGSKLTVLSLRENNISPSVLARLQGQVPTLVLE